jgi:hypothetical protein
MIGGSGETPKQQQTNMFRGVPTVTEEQLTTNKHV